MKRQAGDFSLEQGRAGGDIISESGASRRAGFPRFVTSFPGEGPAWQETHAHIHGELAKALKRAVAHSESGRGKRHAFDAMFSFIVVAYRRFLFGRSGVLHFLFPRT